MLQKARELGVTGGEFEPFSALTVTVPGAAAAWEDTIRTYGKLSLKEVSCGRQGMKYKEALMICYESCGQQGMKYREALMICYDV